MRLLICALLPLVALGCARAHRSPGADGAAAACASEFETCEADDDCCAGTYCDGPYGPSVCTPVSPNGSFCVTSRECVSGTCVENVCGGRVPTCVAAGAACGPDTEACCAGTRCREVVAGPPTCQPPAADGEPCASPDECASGVCTDGRCGAPVAVAACMGRGEYDCGAPGVACCDGFYCEPEGSYYEGHCMELIADGQPCTWGLARCASGHCGDGLCRAAECAPVDSPCFGGTHAECCTGFCDFGFSYGAGLCRERLPAGSPCYDHAWCVSRSCGEDRACL
jgi:hypothetical protein